MDVYGRPRIQNFINCKLYLRTVDFICERPRTVHGGADSKKICNVRELVFFTVRGHVRKKIMLCAGSLQTAITANEQKNVYF